ncbi:sporulation protein [Embleya sp. AB8]|uniref:sporulation protein n=1 Tax=Embleya sp. AB8 TaxID=3156304 RepID=UPI003C78F803
MVFNRVLDAIGVGTPTVETVVSTPLVRPGDTLEGQITVVGGSRAAELKGVTLSLVALTAGAARPGGGDGSVAFADAVGSGPLRLGAQEQRVIPFSFRVPYEAPFTTIAGQRLTSPAVSVRTTLDLDGRKHKSVSNPVEIEPLPVQHRVLDAALTLGFAFKDADLTAGRVGAGPGLPFRQDVAFYASPAYADTCREVALSFESSPNGTYVSVHVGSPAEAFGQVADRNRLENTDLRKDLDSLLDSWIRKAVEDYAARNPRGAQPSPWVNSGGQNAPSQGGGRGGGSGMGGVVGGLAAGAAGGFLGGMLAEEMFGDDDDD